MVDYPQSLPLDAATVLVNAATQGFAPDGEHGDLACCIQSAWNLQGYGLNVWKPHSHLKGKARAFEPPAGEKTQLKALAKLLQPATVKLGRDEVEALPWDAIIALAVSLIRAWLKKLG